MVNKDFQNEEHKMEDAAPLSRRLIRATRLFTGLVDRNCNEFFEPKTVLHMHQST